MKLNKSLNEETSKKMTLLIIRPQGNFFEVLTQNIHNTHAHTQRLCI